MIIYLKDLHTQTDDLRQLHVGVCSPDERLISSSAQTVPAGEWLNPAFCVLWVKKIKKKLILYWLDQLVHHLLTKHAHCNLTPSCQVQKGGRPAKTRSLFFFFFFSFLLSCIEEEKKAKLFQTLHEKLKNASPPARFSTSTQVLLLPWTYTQNLGLY